MKLFTPSIAPLLIFVFSALPVYSKFLRRVVIAVFIWEEQSPCIFAKAYETEEELQKMIEESEESKESTENVAKNGDLGHNISADSNLHVLPTGYSKTI